MKKVLIVDDEVKLSGLLARIISSEGFEVSEVINCKNALKKLSQEDFEVVLCDVKLPDGNGIELTKKIKAANPHTEIILLTAFGNIADGVTAMKNGAFDYIVKGDDNDKIIPLLYKAYEKVSLQKRVEDLEKRISEKFSFDSIIGKSKSILYALDLARKVAALDTAVLLTGETGTGKEVFAQSIHHESPRKSKNFVALNCSSFSKEILESELFGYKQGAFTGATKDKVGLIEEAHEGTLFLDEIGEMPLELQAKLLRVLESNEFIKIGDTKTTKSNFRLIAATNRDLKKEAQEQRFRLDLYYRLNVFQIQLPPLRERKKDIDALIQQFVDYFSARINKKITSIEKNYIQQLKEYHFPGNIRELKNIIERSIILCDNGNLDESLLPFETYQDVQSKTLSAFSLSSIEKLHIQKVLNYTSGNKTEAAKLLEIGIATLYRKIDEFKMQD